MAVLWIAVGAVLVALVGAVAYWLLVITEGTYLGTSAVILMYDWAARRYDKIKDLRYINEVYYVGLPICSSLHGMGAPRILDVATGTGRVPLAIRRAGNDGAYIIGVDRSRQMLAEAQAAAAEFRGRIAWLRADAVALPFDNAVFDAVTCLEALEFVVAPDRALREMVRVLKPGGVLWLSNRVGWEARLFPGRLAGRGRLEVRLREMGLRDIDTKRWQIHYDLVHARKPIALQQPERVGARFIQSQERINP
ncbi:MAG: methyltransferase domain-containing protein [Chloroflexi bacterium]|nr:methyltransferase domain-containing protein [Chloroflexota bacterium]